MIKRLLLLLLLPIGTILFSQGLTGGLPFGASDFNPQTDITVKVISAPKNARTGEEISLKLMVSVPDHYHITKDFFEVGPIKGNFTVQKVILPEGKKNILGEILGGYSC